MSEDAGIEPKNVAALALAVYNSNNSARFHPQEYFLRMMSKKHLK
jgi:hypothetical protein